MTFYFTLTYLRNKKIKNLFLNSNQVVMMCFWAKLTKSLVSKINNHLSLEY